MNVLFFVFHPRLVPLQYLVVVGLPLLGLALFVRDVRSRPRPGAMRLSRGLVILAAVVLYVGLNEAYGPALELNPVVGAQDLVGLWQDGAATLDLRADGSYRCTSTRVECDTFGPSGRGAHSGDGELTFTQGSGDDRRTLLRRVVRYAGALRLTDPFDDPDGWDGALSFAHRAPAS
jgi:hypothetical protein